MTKLADYVDKNGSIRIGMRGDIVAQVQMKLRDAGHEIRIDKDFGSLTKTAVEKYQGARGLAAVGYVGPKTARALDAQNDINTPNPLPPSPLPSVKFVAPWLAQMRAMTGTKEIIGPKDNALILKWPREIANIYPDLGPDVLWYNHDSIAWCGLGMGIAWTRGGEKPPRGLLGAGSWAQAGKAVPLARRTPGCVFVYSRVGGHHVTIYESEDNSFYYCRGANQSDAVCVTRIPKSRTVLAVRWGLHTPFPATGPKRGVTANAVAASEA